MSPSPAPDRPARRLIVNLAGVVTVIAGGLLFDRLGTPLPFILGSLVAAALYSNLVGPLDGVNTYRQGGLLMIGSAVAGLLTAETAAELFRLLPLMLAVTLLSIATAAVLAFPFARVARVDRLTGLLSCLPAGMAEMSNLARELGGREQTVAIVHTLRIIILLALLPLWFSVMADGADLTIPQPRTGPVTILGAFIAASGLLAWIAGRLGMMNAWVSLPMILGLTIVALGGEIPGMPAPLLAAAQITLGGGIGMHFRIEEFAVLPYTVVAGVLSSLALIAVSFFVLATHVGSTGAFDHASATLAVAPGGSGEMIAAAKSLGLASATIAGFQFVRSLVTNLLIPPVVRRAMRHGRT